MLLTLLMNLGMLGDGGAPVVPPAPVVQPTGGWDPRNVPSRKEREEQVRKDRIRFGLIPDDVPQKAVAILEQEAAKAINELGVVDVEELQLAFAEENVKWKQAYAEHFKEFYDALVTLELQRHFQQRRKRLMVFVLMNS